MEAGRDGDRPGPVRWTLGHRAAPLRVMWDGLTSVSVNIHPDTPTELLLGLGEPWVAALETILNMTSYCRPALLCQPHLY